MEIVDQDLIFQSHQTYARIIGGNGEEESLWRLTMVVQNEAQEP
jgi:hypothetical protein